MLNGRLAIVTGAGGGIGRATCAILASAGAKIIATDSNVTLAKDTISKLCDGDHSTFRLNVSSSVEVESVFRKIVEKYYSPPDIIVNVAGITRDNFLINTSEEDYNNVFDVNMKGTFLVTKKACKLLLDAGLPGSIINVSSIVALRGNKGQCNYASSKAAVETFSKCVALEMAKYNIRCNTILPGFIDTVMVESIPEKVKNMFLAMVPLQRLGTPNEVANVIKFLASEESSYVTGSSINVSGGFE